MVDSSTLINDRFQVNLSDTSTFLGQGGMGAVYRGLDVQTKQPVAIKMMRSDLIEREPELVQRFRKEGEALRQLNHPNIVKMLDACECDGINYLVMEYVSGGSLRDVLKQKPQFSVQHALYIALDIADALTRAHRLQILHRDIKPDNVLLAEDGTPRLTDFGMARMTSEPHLTEDGVIVGTMAYLAPEAFTGEEPDERTDIWAFGVMLYELLAGKRPFPQSDAAALLGAIIAEPMPEIEQFRTDLPVALIDLLQRMLIKERAARIPSVRLIGAELEAIIRGSPTGTLQPIIAPNSTGRFELRASDHPPMATSQPHIQTNLPPQPTAFIGREDELSELSDLLSAADTRLITLLGPGGIGKTRLGIELAARQRRAYPDGVYFVPLAGVDRADYVLSAIADVLDVTFGGTNTQQDLLNYLRDKQLLLILDNFEHVMESTSLVSEINNSAAKVNLLVTSRERLRLRGEQIFEVGGMALPKSADETPQALGKFAAVRLFLQSAHRVKPDFEIDSAETAHVVAEIIRQVEGLPLGIELAAAWLESLPVEEIVSEIEKSLDFLETDLRDVPERHRSIRAVFEYSWNLMTDAEKAVFLRLSIFRGGFEREAAQKIAGASLRNLTNLVNKSLLQRTPAGRYYVHKALRQYTQERFIDGSAKEATYAAHCGYYALFASKLAPMLNSHHEKAALEALDVEIENVRLMSRNALQHKHFDALNATQDTLLLYYLAHSMLKEGYATFKSFADTLQADQQVDSENYWKARNRQAWMGSRLGYYVEVLDLATKAEAYFREHQNKVELAYALNQISYVHMMRGNYDAAKRYAKTASTLVARNDNPMAWYMSTGNLGYAHYLAGEFEEAREIYEGFNAASETIEYSITGLAFGKNNLGEILREMGEVEKARTLFHDAYEKFAAINHRRGIAFTLNNMGGVLFMQGEYSQARKIYERAYRINKEIGDQNGIAHSLSALGNILTTAGDYAAARQRYEESLIIRREIGDKRGVADSLIDLARNMTNTGTLDKAEELLDEALTIRTQIADVAGEGYAAALRGLARVMLGQTEAAKTDIERGLQIGEEIGHRVIRAQSYVGMGELALAAGDYEAAKDYYCKAIATHDSDEPPVLMVLFALTGLARIKKQEGDYAGALHLVTLVLRYPRQFIGMIEQRATNMLEELTQLMDNTAIESTVLETKTALLRNVVNDLLAEAATK